jgi:hypothetical protein
MSNNPKEIICGSIFRVKSTSSGKSFEMFSAFRLGEWDDLLFLREYAKELNLKHWQGTIVDELNGC